MFLKPKVSQTDHVHGNRHALIELVEFGDYQCPYCGKANQILKSILNSFRSDLRLVFRHFPLVKIHNRAKPAAIAAEAAALQGKFWEMHDMIFLNQKNLLQTSILNYAEQIGLNTDHFQQDLQNEELAQKVEANFESGIRSGVNQTPSFFINGYKYEGSWQESPMIEYLEDKIKWQRENQIPLL
jgi:protein-disulfide isomerase